MRTDRREFLLYGLITSSAFLGGVYVFKKPKSTDRPQPTYDGVLLDQSERGHQLREATKMEPSLREKTPLLIVGGGMTGLLTGYYLKQNGFSNFKIIELNDQAGGNSSFGRNSVSAYPWGAHYIPLPNKENKSLIDFFINMGMAKVDQKTKDITYTEEYLCHDPQERLFIKGEWQESILPSKNINPSEKSELDAFHHLVEQYKKQKGNDGRFAFDIPVMNSSRDQKFLNLDRITFRKFLEERNLNSEALLWYLNYCMLDDYGMGIESVSAWAGLHYFCSRRSTPTKDDHKIMTWPEGNGWVMARLADDLKDHILTNSAVVKIYSGPQQPIRSQIFNFESKEVIQYESEKLVFAAPQFLTKYIFDSKSNLPQVMAEDYYSWIVANVTLKLPADQYNGLHWDNVRYQSESLGYVHARHQELIGRPNTDTVITLYWPLYKDGVSATDIRKRISGRKWEDWAPLVEQELAACHPGIQSCIQKMDIKVHGHAMIGPKVGRIQTVYEQHWNRKKNEGIYFAHTDNSGMSLFEEAQYWGHRVAQEVLGRGDI